MWFQVNKNNHMEQSEVFVPTKYIEYKITKITNIINYSF